jgi:hypothetical protein
MTHQASNLRVGGYGPASLAFHRELRSLANPSRLAEVHGLPRRIICDNGPEFLSLALSTWIEVSISTTSTLGSPCRIALRRVSTGRFETNASAEGGRQTPYPLGDPDKTNERYFDVSATRLSMPFRPSLFKEDLSKTMG